MSDDRLKRVNELVSRIKPMLRKNEYVAIMTEDFETFILVPDDVGKRAAAGEGTPQDTLVGLLLAHNMHAIILKMHADALKKGAGKVVKVSGNLVGMDGKPLPKIH
jgi:hypothetical protein